ncbi:PilZ domain-containing protein [Candidatus Omnitrophota bacterium]
MQKRKERRGFPRIQDNKVSLKLKAGNFDIITHALNISASGICCKINKELPLMSRVKMALMMPVSGSAKNAKAFEVEGVVVREHPVIIGGKIKHYDVAIFFEECPAKLRELLADYVSLKIGVRS